MKLLRHFTTQAMLIGAFAAPAWALPTLYLSSDGTTWTKVATDGGAGDLSPFPGEVLFNGTFGTFNLETHVGTTFPAIGTAQAPELDLTFKANATTAGNLYIAFSADGFGPTDGSTLEVLGGTAAAGSTVWLNTYGGLSNVLDDQTHQIIGIGPLSGAFNGMTTGLSVMHGLPYSLTEVIHLSAKRAGLSSGEADLLVNPLPDSGATLVLVGIGLASCVASRRKPKADAC